MDLRWLIFCNRCVRHARTGQFSPCDGRAARLLRLLRAARADGLVLSVRWPLGTSKVLRSVLHRGTRGAGMDGAARCGLL